MLGVVNLIPGKNCNLVCIGEAGSTAKIRIMVNISVNTSVLLINVIFVLNLSFVLKIMITHIILIN